MIKRVLISLRKFIKFVCCSHRQDVGGEIFIKRIMPNGAIEQKVL